MATPSIGAVTFEILTGRISPIAMAKEDHTRPGVDGHQSKELGTRGQLAQLQTVKRLATAAAAKTHEGTCAALQASDPVTVTYSDGQTRTNIDVLDVQTSSLKLAALVAGAGSGLYVIRQTWTVRQIAGDA